MTRDRLGSQTQALPLSTPAGVARGCVLQLHLLPSSLPPFPVDIAGHHELYFTFTVLRFCRAQSVGQHPSPGRPRSPSQRRPADCVRTGAECRPSWSCAAARRRSRRASRREQQAHEYPPPSLQTGRSFQMASLASKAAPVSTEYPNLHGPSPAQPSAASRARTKVRG